MSKLDVSKSKKYTWPPTTEQIKDIATSGLNQSQDKDVRVLVYWVNNPKLMIFDPIHFADTDYVKRKYEHNERTIEVIIGKDD